MLPTVKEMVVNLPNEDSKDIPSSGDIPPDELSFQSSAKVNVDEDPNNHLPQKKSNDFPEGYEWRRHSFPTDSPAKEEHITRVKSCTSALPQSMQEGKRKFKLGNG